MPEAPAAPEGSPVSVSPPRGAPGEGIAADARPAAPDTWPAPRGLPAPPGFKPPILKSRPALPALAGPDSVELEVLVDERGRVVRVELVGGTADRAKREAARACALGMSFYPALRAGQPVPAWSRQWLRLGGAAPRP
jgi:hypothetical protein